MNKQTNKTVKNKQAIYNCNFINLNIAQFVCEWRRVGNLAFTTWLVLNRLQSISVSAMEFVHKSSGFQ